MNNFPNVWKNSWQMGKGGGNKMKKIIIPIFILCMFMCLSLTVGAASLSPAFDVIRASMTMIKTGVGQNSVAFTSADFENFVGATVRNVKVLTLPDAEQGKLMLGTEDITAGENISAEMIAAMRFVPAGEGSRAVFDFTTGDNDEKFVCAIAMLPSLDFSPQVASMTVSAMENVTYTGLLDAKDPDGDAMKYKIVKQARHGAVTLDDETGKYIYSPDENFSGKDKFSYVALDEYGNVSDEATVTINVAKNKSGIVYADMAGNDAYTAAVNVGEKGILVGEVVGGKRFYYPEKAVSRGEFLVMAMNAAEIPADLPKQTSFNDDALISDGVRGYVCAAERLGIIFGVEDDGGRYFMGDEAITVSQAATIVSRIISITADAQTEVPVGASGGEEITDEGLYAMAKLGFFYGMSATDTVNRASAAMIICKLIS